MDQKTMRLVKDLIAEAERGDRERFVASHPEPFLVLVGRIVEEGDDDDLDYYTSTDTLYDEHQAAAIVAGELLDPNAPVFPVLKRKGANMFSALITIGRTDNCDFCFKAQSVSKFHAYIARIPQLDDTFVYQFADGGSRNGCKVNDEALKPKELVTLADGDRIEVGGVIFLRFFNASGMWQELDKLRRR
jgi:pSer/pThr/pTyr-binding forkhead associated (FHA) protein